MNGRSQLLLHQDYSSRQWKNEPNGILKITGAASPITSPECQYLGDRIILKAGPWKPLRP